MCSAYAGITAPRYNKYLLEGNWDTEVKTMDKISAEKELITTPFTLDYSDKELLKTLRNTVAIGATDDEFKMFTLFCQSTGLNPLKKEIWFIKTKGYMKDGVQVDGRVQMMTGINGYLAIANRHPMFDGMEMHVEKQSVKKFPEYVEVKVWRKDRSRPCIARAYWDEYYQAGRNGKPSIWDQKPVTMLAKVAKSIGLRESFPQEMSGLYTDDEMPADYAVEPVKISTYTHPQNSEAKIIVTNKAEVKAPQLPQPESIEPFYIYYRPDLNDKQESFFKDNGAVPLNYGYWQSPKDLGPKLKKDIVSKEEYEKRSARLEESEAQLQVNVDAGVEEWIQEKV